MLQPSPNFIQQLTPYSDKIHEAGKAKENVHFLKLQRQQLKELREKILRERELIKEKIDELDEKIKTMKKKDQGEKEKSN
ncbi:hypothetical protein ACLKA6_005273 [Drosophila palustris]